MKRIYIVLLTVVVITITGTGFVPGILPSLNEQSLDEKLIKKSCSGYEVIEANKGIDCYGDTIKLIKKHGFYEIAVNKP